MGGEGVKVNFGLCLWDCLRAVVLPADSGSPVAR